MSNEVDEEKCDCCGSLGGFHMEGCPHHGMSQILVFTNLTETALGTLEGTLPLDWDVRFIRKEGGHWIACEGMTLMRFIKRYGEAKLMKLMDDPTLPKNYFSKLILRIVRDA